jgi:hypothetical protein
MTTAQDVIDAARYLINDETAAAVSGMRWSDAELMDWITDAQRAVVELKPEAYPITEVFAPVAGVSRHRLDSATAYRLIRVEANTTDGV